MNIISVLELNLVFLDFSCKVSDITKLGFGSGLQVKSQHLCHVTEFLVCIYTHFSIGRQFHNPSKCICSTEVGVGSGLEKLLSVKIYTRCSEQAITSA